MESHFNGVAFQRSRLLYFPPTRHCSGSMDWGSPMSTSFECHHNQSVTLQQYLVDQRITSPQVQQRCPLVAIFRFHLFFTLFVNTNFVLTHSLKWIPGLCCIVRVASVTSFLFCFLFLCQKHFLSLSSFALCLTFVSDFSLSF